MQLDLILHSLRHISPSERKRGKFFIGTKVLGYVSLTKTLVFLHNSIRISEAGVMPYEQIFTETNRSVPHFFCYYYFLILLFFATKVFLQ